MNILDIIEKKKNNQVLSEQEIIYFVNNYTKTKEIKDYQMSALLMAILINGMNDEETYWLTKAMLNSGGKLDLSSVKGIIIDKHSTGGVGDKVSLILAPIIASLGVKVAKISGRGLGHTGGTIDKLESIEVETKLTKKQYIDLLNKCNMFIMRQSKDIVPADKKIYALRDVSGTVNSLPLIAASIMSKKLAVGAKYIFLDVKVGDGAFCKTVAEAEKLSKIMILIAKKFKKIAIVHITNMNQPLGRAIGNGIEVKAAIDFLSDRPESNDIKDLIYDFCSDILLVTKKVSSKQQAYKKIDEIIKNGEALELFCKWAVAQGGNLKVIKSGSYFFPKYSHSIKACGNGYLEYISTKEIGLISVLLGSGRLKKDDDVCFHSGIYLDKKTNEYVKKNEVIATLYSSKPINNQIIKKFNDNYRINKNKIKLNPIIQKIVK